MLFRSKSVYLNTPKTHLPNMLRTTSTLVLFLATVSAFSVQQLASRIGARNQPTAVFLYLDSLSGPNVLAPRVSVFGSYLDGLPGKTFSTPIVTIVPTPAAPVASTARSTGSGVGSYLDGLPGKTFTTPVIVLEASPRSGGAGIGSYLDGLPGKTFSTPVFAKSVPAPSGKGMGGYLDGLPGKTFTTPVVAMTPSVAVTKPVAKSSTGFGSYLAGL